MDHADLSISTVKVNNDLTLRVSELEEELAVWKQARAKLVQDHAYDKQQLQAKVEVLEKRLQNVEVSTVRSFFPSGSGTIPLLISLSDSQDSMILCVIDGDGNIFSNNLLVSGLDGGRDAGRALTYGIDEYLKTSNFQSRGRLTLWLTVYFNKKGLQETLVANNVCSMEQFEAFLTGFSQASPRFSLVDVGPGKEAADAKIKGRYRHPNSCDLILISVVQNTSRPTHAFPRQPVYSSVVCQFILIHRS